MPGMNITCKVSHDTQATADLLLLFGK